MSDDQEATVTGLLDEQVSDYLTALAAVQHGSDVLEDMEQRAEEHGFPIVGRAVGRFLETQARAIGAERVMELGSGYGYSAYWFARAVGADGEVVCTDGDPGNARDAEGYLTRAGLWDRVRYHVGDALESFATEDGTFDIVYCDVDKDGYPDCWRAARSRIRMGGLYLCDNTLWDGHVVTGDDRPGLEGWTAAIQEHNRLVTEDPDFVSSIVPIRDGVLVALRVA
ncbi:MAG: O-methyltransferase [Actinobacteria bacterium]|nr:O-methyltransferase [Actinomycetota bacterium]